MEPYARRRATALDAFAEGVAVIPSARIATRSNDTGFPFRQSSDFYYLTGFNEPDAVLVLTPQREKRSVLFLRERDREREIWDGKRLGVERACDELGVDEAHPIAELEQRLPELLIGAKTLHYTYGLDRDSDRIVSGALESARGKTRRKGHAPKTVADSGMVLHEMRLIKTEDELAILRKACAITAIGHEAAMRATRPGIFEYEIQAELENAYRRGGSQSPAYESIVASGDNATVLHYVSNRERLASGALLLVDSGCELDCYTTDVTRTWPVDGRFSAEQRAIYEIVLAAQEAAIECLAPGIARNAFHEAAVATITEGLIDLGLLHGSVDENVEKETYKRYYMHGTGHWLGLDVHDVGEYRDANDDPVALRAGMITTIEPGIYVHRDVDCDERFKGIGVRIEDDILVTPAGNENLTAAIPKTIEELEAIVGSNHRVAVGK